MKYHVELPNESCDWLRASGMGCGLVEPRPRAYGQPDGVPCFVGRQRRLTVEGDHFYVDLVFYNRLLRCFVLVDLKLGKLTHQDLGQMQMYVNYYDRTQRAEHEHKTIGIVLCSEQNAAMVKITLPEDNDQIIAATYRRYLPTEAELAAELERERAEAERVLRLTAPSVDRGGEP